MRLKAKNWDEFQHYNRRNPPWIKLHRNLLDNYDFQRLPVASVALAPLLWLLASESDDGSVDADPDYLEFRLRWPKERIWEGLKPLIDNGFFSGDSAVLASCYTSATPETETEGEAERETEAEESVVELGENQDEESSDLAGKKPTWTSMAREVFEFWQEVMDHPRARFNPDDDRIKKVIKQLKAGYSVEELKMAVVGCSRTPHNMGENDRGQKYDGLNVICKNGDNVDRFIQIAERADMTGLSSAGRQTAAAAQAWLEDEENG